MKNRRRNRFDKLMGRILAMFIAQAGRALAIYTALNDLKGKKESLMLLQKLADTASNRIGSPR